MLAEGGQKILTPETFSISTHLHLVSKQALYFHESRLFKLCNFILSNVMIPFRLVWQIHTIPLSVRVDT